MASIRDLKKRITTVKNTQQTTRAMKMVSAAKLRRCQDAILAHRPYARRIDSLIRLVSQHAKLVDASPLIRREREKPTQERLAVLICVTSDRGLCGGFNANVGKKVWQWTKENESRFRRIEVGFVGKKGKDYLVPRGIDPLFYNEFSKKAEFSKAQALTQQLIADYTEGKIDDVFFVYNEFKNAISQTVIVERFLPLLESEFSEQTEETLSAGATSSSSSAPAEDGVSRSADLFLMRPEPKELLRRLIEKHFTIQNYRIFLESQASEHGARMAAMENATKNAGEMIQKLTLQFNKQRQANITKELLEIIAGSESQKI